MQPIAFAAALAAASAIFAVVLILLRVVAPRLFVIVFNSQFFGADVASLLPTAASMKRLVPGAIIVMVTSLGLRLDLGSSVQPLDVSCRPKCG